MRADFGKLPIETVVRLMILNVCERHESCVPVVMCWTDNDATSPREEAVAVVVRRQLVIRV